MENTETLKNKLIQLKDLIVQLPPEYENERSKIVENINIILNDSSNDLSQKELQTILTKIMIDLTNLYLENLFT